jgi:uncharacterized membrane protein YjgN (DUF898 family)
MSEGWDRSPGAGTEIDADTDAPREESRAKPKGGWVALPPHPDAPDDARNVRRYRAPWATGTTASVARTSAAPPPSAAPEAEADAPAKPKSRRFSLKRKSAEPSTASEAPHQAPSAPTPTGSAPSFTAKTEPPAGASPPAPPAATDRSAQAAPAPSAPRTLEFTGTAGEYFRVWIVNVCLTVLTLGIYSAWAKVRTKRYFYRHTQLEGSPFDYLAEPKQILKGRAILALFMGTYVILGQFMPALQAVMSIALVFLVPWAVVKSLKFRARNAAWRNIRFGFDGSYKEALAVFIGWPMLAAFTFGLAYPYYQWRRNRFVTERSRFGTQPFEYGATPGSFYGIHLKAGALMIGLVVLVALAGAMLPVSMHLGTFTQTPGSGMVAGPTGAGPFAPAAPTPAALGLAALAPLAMMATMGLAYLLVWTFVRARTWSVVWGGTSLGPHGFACTARARDLCGLYIMNTLGIVLSFGLLVPWARVRMARYRVEHMRVTGKGSLSDFAQAQGENVGATGAEFGEALDLDLGL